MTAAQLLASICAALLLQAAAGVDVLVRRRRALASLTPQQDKSAAWAPSAGARSGWRDFRVTRRCFEDAAQTQFSFHLQPVDGAPLRPFQPGQYLTFSLKVPETAVGAVGVAASAGVAGGPAGARSITRCSSLSDWPDPSGCSITIKRMPPPAAQPGLPLGVSSAHFHDRMHQGDLLQVKTPSGHFFVDPNASVPAMFIAGGIGITPMMSMPLQCQRRA